MKLIEKPKFKIITNFGLCCMLIFVTASCSVDNNTDKNSSAIDYVQSQTLLGKNLVGLIKNGNVTPHWIAEGDSFWYRRDFEDGYRYILVQSETGDKTDAFNHDMLAQQLSRTIKENVAPNNINILGINSTGQAKLISAMIGKDSYLCDTDQEACSLKPMSEIKSEFILSPNGQLGATIRDGNIWLKNMTSKQLRKLTNDGEPTSGYGIYPESSLSFEVIENTTPGDNRTPNSLFWSPDGQVIFVQHINEDKVEKYPFLESVPMDGSFRPKVHNVRMALLGDENQPDITYHLIDVQTGSNAQLILPQEMTLSDFVTRSTPLAWSNDNTKLYLLGTLPGGGRLSILEVQLDSGEIQIVYDEWMKNSALGASSDLYHKTNFRILNDGKTLLVQSERNGSMHFYLHDIETGTEIRKLSGNVGRVFDIVRIDEITRTLYFTGSSTDAKNDPYYRYLYKVSLDEELPLLLTNNIADHNFSDASEAFLSPNGKYILDNYSDVKTPPVSVLRSAANGAIISEIEEADVSRLYSAGWTPPIRIKTKAADGSTDLYGILRLPEQGVAINKAPILDAQYINPIISFTPKDFYSAVRSSRSDLSALGFAVVIIDGRGTPRRDESFGAHALGNYADLQIEDHIAAIKQLSDRYAQLDINRVGIFGHSNGGDAAARAILKYGDFFKVAVASAGSHSYHNLPGSAMQLFGVPEYSNGTAQRPHPNEIAENYQIYDNSKYADGLKGKLMIAYGDLDRAALPSVNLQLAAALVKADKAFDMLYIPNSGHSFSQSPYFHKRMQEYFVEHLLPTSQ